MLTITHMVTSVLYDTYVTSICRKKPQTSACVGRKTDQPLCWTIHSSGVGLSCLVHGFNRGKYDRKDNVVEGEVVVLHIEHATNKETGQFRSKRKV